MVTGTAMSFSANQPEQRKRSSLCSLCLCGEPKVPKAAFTVPGRLTQSRSERELAEGQGVAECLRSFSLFFRLRDKKELQYRSTTAVCLRPSDMFSRVDEKEVEAAWSYKHNDKGLELGRRRPPVRHSRLVIVPQVIESDHRSRNRRRDRIDGANASTPQPPGWGARDLDP
jgi:hypothetical protein